MARERASDSRGGRLMQTVLSRRIPVARPYFGLEEETAVLAALRSGWVTQGPRVEQFENEFAHYVSAPHAVAVSSCTTALQLALTAAGIGPGDEVLCPSLSFIASANAIVHSGARPVFVDVCERTYNLDPQRLEDAITARTRAILVVHQIGLPAPLREILEIAERRSLLVIEDAACAIGSSYDGARIGAPHGLMACFSFHPRKILSTGEGGMITTGSSDLAQRLRKLRQHAMTVSDVARHSSGQVVAESYDEVGFNYRMTDLQAAIGLAQLGRLDHMLSRRRALAERYTQELAGIPWLVAPNESADTRHNFQSYMVRLTHDAPVKRDELMQMMLDRGVATRRGVMAIHHERPYHQSSWDQLLPVTNAVAASTMILPLFHELTESEQDYIIEALREAS